MTNYPAQEFWVWKELIAHGTAGSPPARFGHSMWALNGKVYVGFGTFAETSAFNDMWEFDPKTGKWKNVTSTTGFQPFPREYAGSYTNGSSSVCVFGGNNPNPSFPGPIFNDLLCFDPIQNWTQLTANAASGSPPGFSSPATSMMGNSVLQFGGWSPSATGGDNRLNKYNGSWTDMTPLISPGRRWHTKMITTMNQTTNDPEVWMFGGYNGAIILKDLWRYRNIDLWLNIITPTSPEARAHYAMGSIREKIVLFGGGTNNMWTFNTATLTWAEVIENLQPGSPPARAGNANFACIDDKTCLLFGGKAQPSNIPLNDLWQLSEEEILLYDVRISKPIYADVPFNLSWRVNNTYGAHEHTMRIILNGTSYPPKEYSNTWGSTLLNVSELGDFYVTLIANYTSGFTNQTLNFTLQP